MSDNARIREYSVFVHEYSHYLQNISTLSGLLAFVICQNLIANISSIIDNEYSCLGEGGLTEQRKLQSQDLAVMHAILAGHSDSPNGSEDYDLSAYSIESIDKIAYNCVSGVKITVRDLVTDDGFVYVLSSSAIEESVAYELDMIASDKGDTASIEEDEASVFPYKSVRLLARHHGVNLSPPDLIRLGTIALNTCCPGISFLEAIIEMANNQDSPPSQIISTIVSREEENIRHDIDILVQSSIPEIRRRYGERGLLERGIMTICDFFEKYLAKRKCDLFFDINRLLKLDKDKLELRKMLVDVLPCDILQEYRKHTPEEQMAPMFDRMLSFHGGGDNDVESISDQIRVVHCQIHYLYQHLTLSGISSSDECDQAEAKCPFYNCCPLEIRQKYKENCLSSPWRNAQETTCTYGSAVLATRSTLSSSTIRPDLGNRND